MTWPAEFLTGLFLIFSIWSLLIILSSDISPAIATSAALLAPSIIFTAKADFISGIIATKTPSAPFLKNTLPFESLVKMEFVLLLPPAISGNFIQELKILLAIAEWSFSFLKSANWAVANANFIKGINGLGKVHPSTPTFFI